MKEFNINTFSIIGYDPKTKSFGIAVASKWLAVGSIVPYLKSGIGAIATQATTNISYGHLWLEMLQKGKKSQEVLDNLLKDDSKSDFRQVGIIDIYGNKATYTGKNCTSWAGSIIWKNCVVQGNMLVGENVIDSMKNAFENTDGDLAFKLFNALSVWDSEGGNKRGKQSASLLVISNDNRIEVSGKIIDLRVDDNDNPIKELGRLLNKHNELYA